MNTDNKSNPNENKGYGAMTSLAIVTAMMAVLIIVVLLMQKFLF